MLTGEGLVGRTKRVGPYTSTVVLLVDPDFTVGGRLSRLGGVGLVSGQGAGGLRYELIDADAQVRVGDVLTTTASDTFVPDVPVGRVARGAHAGQRAHPRRPRSSRSSTSAPSTWWAWSSGRRGPARATPLPAR